MLDTNTELLLAKALRYLNGRAKRNDEAAAKLAEEIDDVLLRNTEARAAIGKANEERGKHKTGRPGQYYSVEATNLGTVWAQGLPDAVAVANEVLATVPVREGGGAVKQPSVRARISFHGEWSRQLELQGMEQTLLIRKAGLQEIHELDAAYPEGLPSPAASLLP